MAMQNSTVGADEKVVLQTFTRMNAIPRAERCQDLPVLVRITAPSRCAQDQLPGLDVVLIPCNNSSIWGTKDIEMEEKIMSIINQLGPTDRLSLGGDSDFTDLTEMSEEGRKLAASWATSRLDPTATFKLDRLLGSASQMLKNCIGNKNNRQGCVFLVMPSLDIKPWYIEFPLYVFSSLSEKNRRNMELGMQRMQLDPEMKPITCYFVENNFENTVALCISELKSVTTREITIHLEAHAGVNISSIESGGFKSRISRGKDSGMIEIDYLCDNEEKNFIVHLVVSEGTKMLMTVAGNCKGNEGEIRLDPTDVVVQRPESSNKEICPQVAAELIRLQLVKCVSPMLKDYRLQETLARDHRLMETLGLPSVSPMLKDHRLQETLARLWNDIRNSDDALNAPESCLLEFDKDINNMGTSMFLPIWLALQKWQRASTKTLLSLLAAELEVCAPWMNEEVTNTPGTNTPSMNNMHKVKSALQKFMSFWT